jgi:hypothetical protein
MECQDGFPLAGRISYLPSWCSRSGRVNRDVAEGKTGCVRFWNAVRSREEGAILSHFRLT